MLVGKAIKTFEIIMINNTYYIQELVFNASVSNGKIEIWLHAPVKKPFRERPKTMSDF